MTKNTKFEDLRFDKDGQIIYPQTTINYLLTGGLIDEDNAVDVQNNQRAAEERARMKAERLEAWSTGIGLVGTAAGAAFGVPGLGKAASGLFSTVTQGVGKGLDSLYSGASELVGNVFSSEDTEDTKDTKDIEIATKKKADFEMPTIQGIPATFETQGRFDQIIRELGGSIQTSQSKTGLLKLQGDLHSDPSGGIDITSPQASAKTFVEDGETIYKDFVFTNSRFIPKGSAQKANLPKNIENKSFAKASEILAKDFELNPNSPESKKSFEIMMDRLQGLHMDVVPESRPENMGPSALNNLVQGSSMFKYGGYYKALGGDINQEDPKKSRGRQTEAKYQEDPTIGLFNPLQQSSGNLKTPDNINFMSPAETKQATASLKVFEKPVDQTELNDQTGPDALPSTKEEYNELLGNPYQDIPENLTNSQIILMKELVNNYNYSPRMAMLTASVTTKESNGKYDVKEVSYSNTSNERIRSIFGKRVEDLTDEQLTALKKNDNDFFDKIYGNKSTKGKVLGNDEYGDGYKYRGRSYIQLTGKSNYRAASQAIFNDDRLVENPDLITSDPEVASKVFAWYMNNGRTASGISGIDVSSEQLTEEEMNNYLDATYAKVAGLSTTAGLKSRQLYPAGIEKMKKWSNSLMNNNNFWNSEFNISYRPSEYVKDQESAATKKTRTKEETDKDIPDKLKTSEVKEETPVFDENGMPVNDAARKQIADEEAAKIDKQLNTPDEDVWNEDELDAVANFKAPKISDFDPLTGLAIDPEKDDSSSSSKNSLSKIMRMAPLIISAAQLANAFGKPARKAENRFDIQNPDRAEELNVDPLIAQANNAFSNAEKAIIDNLSNPGQLMAALTTLGANAASEKSKIAMTKQQFDISQKDQKAQGDLKVAAANQQSRLAIMNANDADAAAYSDNLNNALAAFSENIGGLGEEMRNQEIMKLINPFDEQGKIIPGKEGLLPYTPMLMQLYGINPQAQQKQQKQQEGN